MPDAMKAGDVVVCRNNRGYAFTEGKEYVIIEYDPPTPWGPHFTAPAYVSVMDDDDKQVAAHAARFKVKA